MRLPPAILVSLALLTIPLTAKAEDAARATQSIIEQQIHAFLKDDVDTAYSYASGHQGIFPDKQRFFEMVKKSYGPVYRPGNYAFGRSKTVGDGEMILQEVMITGQEGKDWSAIYQMQRQPDGSYKINGVQMLRNTDSTSI